MRGFSFTATCTVFLVCFFVAVFCFFGREASAQTSTTSSVINAIKSVVLEYRAEYDGSSNAIYEGWTTWTGTDGLTSAEIWRIARNTFSGTDKTHTEYAGMGGFLYIWDNRSTYFITSEKVIYSGEQVSFNGENVVYP